MCIMIIVFIHSHFFFNYSFVFFFFFSFFQFFDNVKQVCYYLRERERERDFSLGLFALQNAFKRNYFITTTRKYSFLIELGKKLDYTYRISTSLEILNY